MDRTGLQQILKKYLDGTASEQEVLFIETYYTKAGENISEDSIDKTLMAQHGDEIIQKLNRQIAEDSSEMPVPAVHRIHFLRTAWFRYAAAIIIVFGIGAYLWNIQKEKPSVATTNDPAPVQNDVAPGGDKAILTLADGTTIILDSAGNGLLAKQGETNITKKDGSIIYDAKKYPPSEGGGGGLVYNTMRTPRGGQYQLTLPDGTQVWLNAESSITYPTAFSGKERKVSISGEAYFEVKKDKSRKFIVSVLYPPTAGIKNADAIHEGEDKYSPLPGVDDRRSDGGGLEIEVLGTYFNVNAYTEEQAIRTTLIEGSVRVHSGNDAVRIEPGEQAVLTSAAGSPLTVNSSADLEHVLAWKNGTFVLNNTDLPTIMRQIMRWYEVDVVYEGRPTGETFGGVVSRNLPLSEILDLLKNSGVSFRLDGRTLYVRP